MTNVPGHLFHESIGQGEPLVLIHGNTGDRRHWDNQFEALSSDYRVVRYDVRGYGRSPLPAEDERYAHHRDLGRLLDALQIDSAHLAGWSMGSGIALDFALVEPARVKSLVLVGPWVNGYVSPAVREVWEHIAGVAAAFAAGGPAAAADAWMTGLFAAAIRDPAAATEFRRIADGFSWRPLLDPRRLDVLDPAAADRLGEIDAPALIVSAEHDIGACREVADLLHSRLPRSRKIEMTGTGHLMHMEQPREFNRHLTDFLRSATKPSP